MSEYNIYPGIYSCDNSFPPQYNGEEIFVRPHGSTLAKGPHYTCDIRINGTTLRLPVETAKEWIKLLTKFVNKHDPETDDFDDVLLYD